MLDTIANKLDDAVETMIAGVMIAVVVLAKAAWFVLAAVAPIALVAGGIAINLPVWRDGLPLPATVLLGIAMVFLGARIGIEDLIWLRAKVADMLYLRQLLDNMPESRGSYCETRHSWCERRGTRHEVVVKEMGHRLHAAYVDGERVDRYYSDWLTALEDVSVRILRGRV